MSFVNLIKEENGIGYFHFPYKGRNIRFTANLYKEGIARRISPTSVRVESDVLIDGVGAEPTQNTMERKIYDSVSRGMFAIDKTAIIYEEPQLRKFKGKDCIVVGHASGACAENKNQIIISNISEIVACKQSIGNEESYIIICDTNLMSTMIGTNATTVIKISAMFRNKITFKDLTEIETDIKRFSALETF